MLLLKITFLIYLTLNPPFWSYILIITGIFILIKFLHNRNNKINLSLTGFVPLGGYEDVDLITYNKLKWIIQTPNTKYNPNVTYKDIYINPDPYCPKCDGKLKVKENFLWNTFICRDNNCGFKIRARKSKEEMQEDLQEICRRDFKKYSDSIN